MYNQLIEDRLEHVYNSLMSGYKSGANISSSSKGSERELFISNFLSQTLPPHYRFSSGDITSFDDQKTGQIDIVLESPNIYSFPTYINNGPRVFPAESVAAAIEIKSNIKDQWSEVIEKAKQISIIKKRGMREYLNNQNKYDKIKIKNDYSQSLDERIKTNNEKISKMNRTRSSIPFYIIGFDGWSRLSTLKRKFKEVNKITDLNGIICLKSKTGVFKKVEIKDVFPNFGTYKTNITSQYTGVEILWKFLDSLDINMKETLVESSIFDR